MTDKELLEKAAKAAGLGGYIHEWINGPELIIPGENPITWNPLTDDGDALRLASESGLIVDFWHERVIDGIRFGEGHRDWIYAHDHGGSMNRAITRAAAAMVNQ